MNISNLKLDVKKLEVGKIYPSFDGGVRAPETLCFIKVKEVTSDGYIVDVSWAGEVVATNVGMVYINKFSLKSTDLYGGIITSNICKYIQSEVFDKGYRTKDGVVIMPAE